MQKEMITQYSQALNREMHVMIYGHDGIPFLCFPTQDSMCHNYEDFGMTDQLADYIDGGRRNGAHGCRSSIFIISWMRQCR